MTCGSLASGAIESSPLARSAKASVSFLNETAVFCLVVGAIESVNAGTVAAQRCNDGAVSIEHNCSFAVALSGTGCDCLIRRFDRERR